MSRCDQTYAVIAATPKTRAAAIKTCIGTDAEGCRADYEGASRRGHRSRWSALFHDQARGLADASAAAGRLTSEDTTRSDGQ